MAILVKTQLLALLEWRPGATRKTREYSMHDLLVYSIATTLPPPKHHSAAPIVLTAPRTSAMCGLRLLPAHLLLTFCRQSLNGWRLSSLH